MKNRLLVFVVLVAAMALVLSPAAFAQRGRGGQGAAAPAAPAQNVPVPRTADGKPDFSGLWGGGGFGGGCGGGGAAEPTVYQGGNAPRQKTRRETGLADTRVPLAPWGKEAFMYYTSGDGEFGGETGGPGDSRYHGGTCGGPKSPSDLGNNMQISQAGQLLKIAYDNGDPWVREIWIGIEHPKDITDYVPFWMGHSVAKWEGDTLVVDTVRIKEGTMLNSGRALPQSGNLHMTERFHYVSGNLVVDKTYEDPVAYLKPWTETATVRRTTNFAQLAKDHNLEESRTVCNPHGGYWAENDPWFDNYDKIKGQFIPDLKTLDKGPPPVPEQYRQH